MASIVDIASNEVGTALTTNRTKVLEYIQVSGGDPTLPPEPRSWCGDFAFWVLSQAKISPLPAKWQPRPMPQGSNAIPRFFDRFPKTTHPLPGDMYYRPNTRLILNKQESLEQGKDVFEGNNAQHVGFVLDPDLKPGSIQSLDGNGGGPNENWSLGRGGGVVSIGSPPLTGTLGIHSFLQVAVDVEIEGRWEVQIGVYTWHYVFQPGGQVLCTDIRNTTTAQFAGTWTNDGTSIKINWTKTGSVETWPLPLVRANQQGSAANNQYTLQATKIETKKRVGQTQFTLNLQ